MERDALRVLRDKFIKEKPGKGLAPLAEDAKSGQNRGQIRSKSDVRRTEEKTDKRNYNLYVSGPSKFV